MLRLPFIIVISLLSFSTFFAQTEAGGYGLKMVTGQGVTGPGTQYTLDQVNWTVDASQANLEDENDFFKVLGFQRLEARDLGGEITWSSVEATTRCHLNVSIVIAFNVEGDFETDDYLRFFYQVDNQNPQLIGGMNGNDLIPGTVYYSPSSPEFPTHEVRTTLPLHPGQNFKILAKIKNDADDEFYRINFLSGSPDRNDGCFSFPSLEVEEPWSQSNTRITHFSGLPFGQQLVTYLIEDASYTGPDAATPGEDYTFVPQTLTYNAETGFSTTGTEVSIQIHSDDDITEGNEIVRLKASVVEGFATIRDPFFDFIIINSSEPALAVDLTDFEATITPEGNVELNWETTAQTDHKTFVIEHSIDGSWFNPISEIQGEGTTRASNFYNYRHNFPQKGTNYYRLKQLNQSGVITFSSIVDVNVKLTNSLRLINTLVQDQLIVEWDGSKNNSTANLEIFDAGGKRQIIQALPTNRSRFSISTNELSEGFYFVKVAGLEMETLQFVVQR